MPTHQFTQSSRLLSAVTLVSIVLIGLDRLTTFSPLRAITTALYEWMLLLAAFSILLGIVNVAWLHIQRIMVGEAEWLYSLALIVTFLAVAFAGFVGASGTTSPLMEWIFDSIIAPSQATLFAILIFFMAAAAFQWLRLNNQAGAWLLSGVLCMLITQLPMSALWLPTDAIDGMRWLLSYPVMAVLRGVLLGSGLALLIIGLRTITGGK